MALLFHEASGHELGVESRCDGMPAESVGHGSLFWLVFQSWIGSVGFESARRESEGDPAIAGVVS